MFTGLIETVGTVRGLRRQSGGARLDLGVTWPDGEAPVRGDSVAVNGACLTAIEVSDRGFGADLSGETLSLTLLGKLGSGDEVNLERALRLGDRLGGHIVQGHVDAMVRLLGVEPSGGFSRWRLSLPADRRHEVAHKGSVCLHGVSLTVADLSSDSFEVALIPETLNATNLGRMRPGAHLHLETDILAKYVAGSLGHKRHSAVDEIFGRERA